MKRTILLLFTLVVTTIGKSIHEDAVKSIANMSLLTEDEVQTCFNKTDITGMDLRNFDPYEVDFQDLDNMSLKIGCLLACLGQKKDLMTGAQINANKIKEVIRSLHERTQHRTHGPHKDLAQIEQEIDSCVNEVTTNSNECEVALRFALCVS